MKARLAQFERRLAQSLRPEAGGELQPIAITRDGEIIGEIRKSPSAARQVQFATKWEVLEVDRLNVDLEALRGLFTDRELKLACARHLSEHGPDKLQGVTYRQMPKL